MPALAMPIEAALFDGERAIRICESVEKGHSKQSDTARIVEELGNASDPVRLDSQCKYAVVARGLLDELKARTDKARNNRVATSRAFGAVESWNFARIDRDLAELPEVWNRYRAVKPYWG